MKSPPPGSSISFGPAAGGAFLASRVLFHLLLLRVTEASSQGGIGRIQFGQICGFGPGIAMSLNRGLQGSLVARSEDVDFDPAWIPPVDEAHHDSVTTYALIVRISLVPVGA